MDKRYAIEMQRLAAEEYEMARDGLDVLRSARDPRYIISAAMWTVYAQTEAESFARLARREMGIE